MQEEPPKFSSLCTSPAGLGYISQPEGMGKTSVAACRRPNARKSFGVSLGLNLLQDRTRELLDISGAPAQQIVAGHNALFDDLNAIIGERSDRWADQIARDFL